MSKPIDVIERLHGISDLVQGVPALFIVSMALFIEAVFTLTGQRTDLPLSEVFSLQFLLTSVIVLVGYGFTVNLVSAITVHSTFKLIFWIHRPNGQQDRRIVKLHHLESYLVTNPNQALEKKVADFRRYQSRTSRRAVQSVTLILSVALNLALSLTHGRGILLEIGKFFSLSPLVQGLGYCLGLVLGFALFSFFSEAYKAQYQEELYVPFDIEEKATT